MKTATTKKEKAIEIMKKMDIYKSYIKDFEEYDKVYFFSSLGRDYPIDQESEELYAKMKDIERECNCLVYAVTDEYGDGRHDENYIFLAVTDYPEEWDALVHSWGNYHTAFAYVWCWDRGDWCAEIDNVTTVKSHYGRIVRLR